MSEISTVSGGQISIIDQNMLIPLSTLLNSGCQTDVSVGDDPLDDVGEVSSSFSGGKGGGQDTGTPGLADITWRLSVVNT